MRDRARSYMQGNCDVMALALNRLTGLPMGLWSGKFVDTDADDGFSYEYAHACVLLAGGEWLDVNGIGSETPVNLYFSASITEIVLLPASEDEIRDAFTCCEIDEESILAAMDFALSYPPLAACIEHINRQATTPGP